MKLPGWTLSGMFERVRAKLRRKLPVLPDVRIHETWRCERCGGVWPWFMRHETTNNGCHSCHSYGAISTYRGAS